MQVGGRLRFECRWTESVKRCLKIASLKLVKYETNRARKREGERKERSHHFLHTCSEASGSQLRFTKNNSSISNSLFVNYRLNVSSVLEPFTPAATQQIPGILTLMPVFPPQGGGGGLEVGVRPGGLDTLGLGALGLEVFRSNRKGL